jgi:hypothetical protein
LSGHKQTVKIWADYTMPSGVALAPRSTGLPVSQPVALALPTRSALREVEVK